MAEEYIENILRHFSRDSMGRITVEVWDNEALEAFPMLVSDSFSQLLEDIMEFTGDEI